MSLHVFCRLLESRWSLKIPRIHHLRSASCSFAILPACCPRQLTTAQAPPQPRHRIGSWILDVAACGISKQYRLNKAVRAQDFKAPLFADLAPLGLDNDRRCGEDAFCVVSPNRGLHAASCMLVVAVADGVGGWASVGADPGVVSHFLMKALHAAVANTARDISTPLALLSSAYDIMQSEVKPDLVGSTTACVTYYSQIETGDLQLQSINLGDSGFIVIRHGEFIAYRSQAQLHGGTAPYQMAVVPPHSRYARDSYISDKPAAGHQHSLALKDGDLVISGTDGLFDNIDGDGVLKIIKDVNAFARAMNTTPSKGTTPTPASQEPAATHPYGPTAYMFALTLAASAVHGRKVDDITVTVTTVRKQLL